MYELIYALWSTRLCHSTPMQYPKHVILSSFLYLKKSGFYSWSQVKYHEKLILSLAGYTLVITLDTVSAGQKIDMMKVS